MAANVITALKTKRPEKALIGLFGNRRSRTIRGIVQTLEQLEHWRGSRREIFTMQEEDLIDLLHDLAEKPCGKGVPEKLIGKINVIWNKMGIPAIVGSASSSQARMLTTELSAANPRTIRKALTTPLVVIVAIEMGINDGTLTGVDRAVLGAELVKVYTSSRWDDLRHLDDHALLEKEQ